MPLRGHPVMPRSGWFKEPVQGTIRLMGMSLRMTSVGLVGLLTATLTSCTSDNPSPGDPRPRSGSVSAEQVGADAVVLLDSSRLGLDARVVGQVALVGDCLGIGDSVALWPAMTKVVSENPLVIDVPNAGRVGVGDMVQGAGGRVDAATHGKGVEVPSSCGTGRVVTFRAE